MTYHNPGLQAPNQHQNLIPPFINPNPTHPWKDNAHKTNLRGWSYFIPGGGAEWISNKCTIFSYPPKMTGKFFIPPQKDLKIFHTPHLPSSHLHPCLTDPREVRNLRGEGPPQDHFAWGELEDDICVGIAWGRLGYKGSLCGEGVMRTDLRGEVSVRVRV